MYAAALARVRPSPEWLSAFFRHSAPHLPRMGPQALSNILWGLATLGRAPGISTGSRDWEKGMYAAVVQTVRSPLCNTAVSVWLRHRRPCVLALCVHVSWLCVPRGVGMGMPSRVTTLKANRLIQTLRGRRSCTCVCVCAQALANICWALGKMDLFPGPHVTSVLAEAVSSQCTAMTEQGVANAVWGLAKLRAPLSTAWWDTFQRVRAHSSACRTAPMCACMLSSTWRALWHECMKTPCIAVDGESAMDPARVWHLVCVCVCVCHAGHLRPSPHHAACRTLFHPLRLSARRTQTRHTRHRPDSPHNNQPSLNRLCYRLP